MSVMLIEEHAMKNYKKIIFTVAVFFSINFCSFCEKWKMDVIGNDILIAGDKISFIAYTTEKNGSDNVVFTIYEKSSNKKIASILGEDLKTYPLENNIDVQDVIFDYDKYSSAYIGSWKVLDTRENDDCSKLWYYVEVSVNEHTILKAKSFRVWNPHVVEYKLLSNRGNKHTRGIYYREYASLYIKGCDLDGISDYLKVEYTEKDKSTDGIPFFSMLIPNKGKDNIYKSKKIRFVTTNNEIDWIEKCEITTDLQIYPQIYLYYVDSRENEDANYIRRKNNCPILLESDTKLLKDFDKDLLTHVGVGITYEEVPSYVFKDLNMFSILLKKIEKRGYEGFSAISFNNGEFILQL